MKKVKSSAKVMKKEESSRKVIKVKLWKKLAKSDKSYEKSEVVQKLWKKLTEKCWKL